jgi:hypothetical protein
MAGWSNFPPLRVNGSESPLKFGFIKFKETSNEEFCIIGYRYKNRYKKILCKLFELLRSEYRTDEYNLKMLADRNVIIDLVKSEYKPKKLELQMLADRNLVLDMIKKMNEENSIYKTNKFLQSPTEELQGREAEAKEQSVGESTQTNSRNPWEQIENPKVGERVEDHQKDSEAVGARHDDPHELISDLPVMRGYYKEYSVDTAMLIIESIPKAWYKYKKYKGGSGRWGPGYISKQYNITAKRKITPTTVGRYLKAFVLAGITEIEGEEGVKIQIPYTEHQKPIKFRRKNQSQHQIPK